MWIEPLVGGALIGLAATLMMALNGLVMGVSGIVGGLLDPREKAKSWRWAFLLGMLSMALLLLFWYPSAFAESPASSSLLIVGGFLVGLGTRLGSGCTSGHGVCGMSRFSLRSLVATLSFMLAGFITVWLVYA
jgi:uncharacterized membrane protein YedE/YeeE